MNNLEHVKPFKYWCQKVLPLVYDDSLSYYELLCKVVDYLNKCINNENILIDGFDELKNYVEHYFDNLDVTKEINAKLDALVAEGRLDIMLNMFVPYVTPEMFGAKGDGVNDDSDALLKAIATNKPILCDKNKVYGVSKTLEFTGECFIKNGRFKAISALTTFLIYHKRTTRIYDCYFDGNGITDNGIVGTNIVPTDTNTIADIHECSVINCKNDGFSTGAVRTSFTYCFAKNCECGFNIKTTDTYHNFLVPIDNHYGMKIIDSTSIGSVHPWQWDRKQIAFYVADNCNNFHIDYLYDDTNDVCFSLPNNCRINVSNVSLLNNDQANVKIDDFSRFISRRGTSYTDNMYISIDSISGSYNNDTYMIFPDNYSIATCVRVRDSNLYSNPLNFRGLKQSILKSTQFNSILNLIEITNMFADVNLKTNIYSVKFTPDSVKMLMRLDYTKNGDITFPPGVFTGMKFNLDSNTFIPSVVLTSNHSNLGFTYSYDTVDKTINLSSVKQDTITDILYLTLAIEIQLYR